MDTSEDLSHFYYI